MARQNKTAKTKQELLNALEASLGVVTMACKKVGVTRALYYKHYNNDSKFAAKCDEIQEVALDFAESQLHKQIKDGNTAATIFYLKTKGKRRGYIEKQQIEQTGPVQVGFNYVLPEPQDDDKDAHGKHKTDKKAT